MGFSLTTIDFETDEIKNRPEYPPIPVGVSIRKRGRGKYYAWGHPSENNCTKAEARRALLDAFKNDNCLFHNGAFDIDVGQTHLNLPFPKREFHDTLFLGYLYDPRQRSLSLKPMADAHLDMPPDEQTELKEWILANVPEAKKRPKQWGAFIGKAPGKLVGKYANGDTLRTEKLFNLFYPYCRDMEMLEAYDTERNVLRVKLAMERHGIQTAHKRLARDVPKWEHALDDCGKALKKKLKITKGYEEANCKDGWFNINSSEQLADAIEHAGLTEYWIYTEKDNRSTSLENLQEVVTDKRFLDLYAIYSTLEKSITGFLRPWVETGNKDGGGRIYPTFNQVRSDHKYEAGSGGGTKTGRPSVSNPNFNNIPANVEEAKNADVLKKVAAYLKSYGINFIGLRDYITPSPGNWLITRDYQQQELRVLAHYEDGALMQSYIDNPALDIHDAVRHEIHTRTGILLPRKASKTIAFGILYGFGLDTLAEALDTTRNEAANLKKVYMQTLPGVDDLQKELKAVAKADQYIRTAGGRIYYCEEPKYVNGRYRTFDYKLLNLLIQGTSADITKRAMVKAHDALTGQIVIQLYDEILGDTPNAKRDMPILRECMETAADDLGLDVPLPTDGEYSKISWGRMRPCNL